MYTLEFLNHRFRKDLNVTVRDGPKWNERVKTGDIVELAETIVDPETGETSSEKVSHGQVLDAHFFDTIEDIPEVYLQCAHDRSCTTKLGLTEAMNRTYPDGWGSGGLTVIMFLKMR